MPSFPLEVRLDGRFGSDTTPPARGPISTGDPLPEPVFPQYPELLNDDPWPGDDQRRWSGEAHHRWRNLADDLRQRLGPGTPLDPSHRAAFEGHLGGDLSGVMVHRSRLAGYLARSVGASALSTGGHVLGDPNMLDESTPGGAAVLGHELSHVLQREMDDAGAEQEAQIIERAISAEGQAASASSGTAGVDLDALTERVYQRMFDQLRRERDAGAWIV